MTVKKIRKSSIQLIFGRLISREMINKDIEVNMIAVNLTRKIQTMI